MQRKYGLILGYIGFFVSNITSFILTPLMIYAWGAGDFGVYKLIFSITAYFMLLDLGVGNSIIRFIAEYRSKYDKENEKKFMGSIMIFYGAVSIITIGIGVVIPQFFGGIFRSLTPQEIELAKILFTITIINAAVNLFFNSFNAIIKAYEAYIFLNINNLVKNMVRICLLYYLLKKGNSVYTVVFTDLIINLIFSIINAGYVFIKLKVFPKFKGITLDFIQNIYGYSFFVFIEMIAYQMFWSVDSIVLGIVTSSAIIGVYSIGALITSQFEAISVVIQNMTMSRIVQMVTTDDSKDAVFSEIVKVARIKLFIICLPAIGFMFLGKKFLYLWLGEGFVSAYYVTIIVLIPQIIVRIQDAISNVMWAKNKQKEKSFISIVVAGMNVVITVILVGKMGMFGAAIGTSFAFITGYLICEGLYVHKKLDINIINLYKGIYRGTFKALLLICILSWLISVYTALSWLVFIIQIISIVLVYVVVMWRIGLKKEEKEMVRSLFLRANKKM
ncbi:oligosaccharide flippase family protein [Bacillus mobilis]|uniref:oligosaccharide flippase family protein n=1 Tax=Bacillus mobilis TaxID=2026190 RepID=UPI0013D49121|nr:oligosaccharide flippase family protein [Bacillus mobilis]NEK99466.1 polysaccharide biosynthesis protein [Bacillus mobilis]